MMLLIWGKKPKHLAKQHKSHANNYIFNERKETAVQQYKTV